jgi:hypothetical protein
MEVRQLKKNEIKITLALEDLVKLLFDPQEKPLAGELKTFFRCLFPVRRECILCRDDMGCHSSLANKTSFSILLQF